MTSAVKAIGRRVDSSATLAASKRLRVEILRRTVRTLAAEIRVIECFGDLPPSWQAQSCRNKLRQVLQHGAAFAPSELALMTGDKLNTVRSSLARMRARGEVHRVDFGRWISTRESSAQIPEDR